METLQERIEDPSTQAVELGWVQERAPGSGKDVRSGPGRRVGLEPWLER